MAVWVRVNHEKNNIKMSSASFKGIVSRDFGGLQMILMERIFVPDVPLEVYSLLNLHLRIVC